MKGITVSNNQPPISAPATETDESRIGHLGNITFEEKNGAPFKDAVALSVVMASLPIATFFGLGCILAYAIICFGFFGIASKIDPLNYMLRVDQADRPKPLGTGYYFATVFIGLVSSLHVNHTGSMWVALFWAALIFIIMMIFSKKFLPWRYRLT